MVNGKFLNAKKGEKDGRAWYRMEVLAEDVNGGYHSKSEFCSETAFMQSNSLVPLQDCKVAMGINDKGFWIINAIKGE